ncbi:hypothetical protein [Phormidesmis priestleyi]|nr:hypothetical protein [Phormidesmis priestleyi]
MDDATIHDRLEKSADWGEPQGVSRLYRRDKRQLRRDRLLNTRG